MDRNVNIISGMTLSGKSHLLRQILNVPEFRNAAVVRMDDIRKRYWGDRDGQSMTATEKVYRNILTFREIETKLVIDGASMIFVEVPMLTRKHHQQPLVDITREAERYLQAIERERACIESKAIPDYFSQVHLNVVLLYCSVQSAVARLERRRHDVNTNNTDVFSLDFFLEIALDFELPEPTTYLPLSLNTSDESSDAERQRLEEVVSFFNGKLQDTNFLKKRLEEAEFCLAEARRLARQRDLVRS